MVPARTPCPRPEAPVPFWGRRLLCSTGTLTAAMAALLGSCSGETVRDWGTGVVRAEGDGKPRQEQAFWIHYDRDGQVRARGSYDDGLKTSLWETFYPSGGQGGGIESRGERLPLREQGISVRQGLWTFFHPSGRVRRRGTFERGKEQGFFEEWYGSGRKKSEQTFASGVLEGLASEWWEDGTLKAKGAYRAGQRSGPWSAFLKDGSPDPALDGIWEDARLRARGSANGETE